MIDAADMDKEPSMEIRELRYFVALAEELHFVRAAARIGIEPPPLSKAISQLERRLGVRLFIRTRRCTILTSVGELLLGDARRILTEVNYACRSIIEAASGRSGRLRIAICDGFAHPRIATLLAQSRQDEPAVDIQIIHSSFPEQLRALRAGVVDAGFGLLASNDQELRSIPLWKDPAVIVIRPDHRLAEQQSINRIDVDSGLLIFLGPRSLVGSGLDNWLLSVPRNCNRLEYVASMELLLTMVAAGYGIGILSAAQTETIRRSDLIVRPVNASEAVMTTFLLKRIDVDSGPVARFTDRAVKMVSAAAGDKDADAQHSRQLRESLSAPRSQLECEQIV